jgi:hypothetical protein
MKIKSLIIAALCTVSIMCTAEDIQFSGNIKNDFNQFIVNTPDKIKTFADIKNWCLEYKTKVPNANINTWTAVSVSCNTLCKTNSKIFEETLKEIEVIGNTNGKTGQYFYSKFFTIQNGKKFLNANDAFEKQASCLIEGNTQAKTLVRMLNLITSADYDVNKEIKVKYYKMMFERYYVQLAENQNTEQYKYMKQFLSKVGLKLKSLGVDVK